MEGILTIRKERWAGCSKKEDGTKSKKQGKETGCTIAAVLVKRLGTTKRLEHMKIKIGKFLKLALGARKQAGNFMF